MLISRSLLIAGLIAATANVAWADKQAYVCKVRVETGFTKIAETSLPHSAEMRVEALLMTQPYCQGTSAGQVNLATPKLERVRSRKKVLVHMSKARNIWQAALSGFQVLALSSAQGIPLNRANVIATNVEEQPSQELAFQATRVASTKATGPKLATGQSGASMSGYVCFSRTSFKLGDPNAMTTVADIQHFEVRLYSEPFCLGKEVGRKEYEFGPPMRMPRSSADQLFEVTANLNASALMHSIQTLLLSAASAGQHVTISHTADGMIAHIEIMARPRDVAKELNTIATPSR